jgi:large subunit ribosomal protein L13Ae
MLLLFGYICCSPLLRTLPSSKNFKKVKRNQVKYAQFRAKHMNTNPSRGPYHYKSPAMMVWRTIRGMVHHMTARGQNALQRLSTFEGIPAPYDKQQRMVIPAALRVMRLKPGRDYCSVGALAHTIGWKHKELLVRLEAKRKIESAEYYAKKREKNALRKKAEEAAAGELEKVNSILKAAGY